MTMAATMPGDRLEVPRGDSDGGSGEVMAGQARAADTYPTDIGRGGSPESSVEISETPVSVGEVDQHRCVVGRLLALAGVAVDERPGDAVGHRWRREHEIDAHAAALVEVAPAVVPVAVEAILVVDLPERVDEA